MLAAGAIGTATAGSWVDSLGALAHRHARTRAAGTFIQPADWKPQVLSSRQNETVVMLTELIIPRTETPGAKAVGVNRFIDGVLNAASLADRAKFLRGLTWMDERSRASFGKDFVDADAEQQTTLLTRVADEDNTAEEDRAGVEFFRAIKSMTISGYYTTEVGLRQELGDDGHLAMTEFAGCDHPEHL